MNCKNGVCSIGTETYEEVVCRKAVETFGEQYQMVKAINDLTRLIQVLTMSLNKVDDESVEDEVAGVYIALEQLRIMLDTKKIDEAIKLRIKELEKYVW